MSQRFIELASLALVDQQCEDTLQQAYSYAEYELVRRVIQQTGDWEYQSLIRFSDRSLVSGAAALAARSAIVTDLAIVEAGIREMLEATFINPIYCAESLSPRRRRDPDSLAHNLVTLAERYPEAIFIIGQDQQCLITLLDLLETNTVQSPLVIATPANFVAAEVTKKRLQDCPTPQICVDGSKGNAIVAISLFHGLLDLAWQMYEQNEYNLSFIENV